MPSAAPAPASSPAAPAVDAAAAPVAQLASMRLADAGVAAAADASASTGAVQADPYDAASPAAAAASIPEAGPAAPSSPSTSAVHLKADANALATHMDPSEAAQMDGGEVKKEVGAGVDGVDAAAVPPHTLPPVAVDAASAPAAPSPSPSAVSSASSSPSPSPSSSPAPAAAAAATPASSPSPASAPAASSSEPLLNGGYKRPGEANDPVTGYYDEMELEDMEWDPDREEYTYPCPCGDKFSISKEELLDGEDIARCPSCSLLLKVIFDPEDLEDED